MKLIRLLIVQAAMLASCLTAAAESIVSVSSGGIDRLVVELSDIAEMRTLWVALDSNDKGSTVSAWTYWCRAADVAPGTTRAEIVLPKKKAFTNCTVLRCALLPTNVLPGAERLLSITPQNAFIKTDLRPTGTTRVELEAVLNTSSRALFCSRLSSYPNEKFYSVLHVGSQLRYDYDDNQRYASPVAVNTHYVITSDPTGLSVQTPNGVQVASCTTEPHDFTAGSDLYLFGTHANGVGPGAFFDGMFYGLKAWTQSTDLSICVLELVPSRMNGVVGLLDVAGGGFLTPINGGMLTAGDKAADAGEPIAWSSAYDMTNGIEISSFDKGANKMTVRLNKVTADASLWLAYGTSDAGTNVADWPHIACVGEVKAGETLKSVRPPKGWNDQMVCTRAFLLNPDSLPNVTRLVSVSPKNALVKTEFRPTGWSRVEMDAQLATSARALFCARASTSGNSFSLMHISATALRYDYDSKLQQVATVASGTRYSIAVGPFGLLAHKTDGTVSASFEDLSAHDFTAGSDLYLFGTHANGANPGAYFDGVFYGLKAWSREDDLDGLELDLVPAKKGSVVGIYDRRNGSFLMVSNSGSLTAGAEQASANDVRSVSGVFTHAPCTVTVVGKTSRRLSVVLSGVETESELWVVADSHDHANDTLGWSEYVKVADVVPGQTSVQVALPERWRKVSLKLRCVLYSKDAAPGYNRLISVTPKENAYVNTHFTPTGASAVEISVGYQKTPGNEGLFCARAGNSGNAFALVHLQGKGLRYDYVSADNTRFLALPTRERHAIRVDAGGITWDDEPTPRLEHSGVTDFTAGSELFLWTMASGGASFSSPMTAMFCGSRAWSDYKNRNDETLVFDLVPCQDDNGAFILDRKTRQRVALGRGSVAAGCVMGDCVIAQSETVHKTVSGLLIVFR